MDDFASVALAVCGGLAFLAFAVFGLISLREREPRAARVSFGTDCATCVGVCPYSHPDSAAHNLVRWAIGRSPAARRAMLWMDDAFYGKKAGSIDKIKG